MAHEFFKKYSFKSVDGSASGLIDLSQEQLDELHKVLLPIMVDIINYCKKHKLTCFLSGGTALGAVRHKGFIPWDDDVDLNMTRESFNKFIPGFRKKYADKYWVHSPKNNPYFGLSIGRIRKKGTIVKTREDLIDDSEAGAYVDIFVVENVYDNKVLRKIQGILCLFTKICLSCRRFYRDRQIMEKTMQYDSSLNQVSRNRRIIGFLCSFLKVETWNRINEKVFQMCKNKNSKYVSIPAGKWHFFGEMYERKKFCKLDEMEFAGIKMPVCSNMDEYMTILYGEKYMDIPSPNKREKHLCWSFKLLEDN